jgi:hypothetical protein
MKRLTLILGLLCCFAGCSKRPAEVTAHVRPQGFRDTAARRVKIYPYSLIPGGVESAGEFRAYRTVDPKLAEHYQGLGDRVALSSLSADKWLYASYRTSDGIYWTKKPLLVHRGEAVLTDGENLVRARCGNRLAETAQEPVRKFEPPVVASDQAEPDAAVKELEEPPKIALKAPGGPDLPGLSPADRPRETARADAPSAQTAPTTSAPTARLPVQLAAPSPGVFLPPPGRGVSTLYVPEPGTGTLFLAGLIIMLGSSWFLRWRRKHPAARR